MAMPLDPNMQAGMQEGPVSMDMLLQLRNQARGRTDMQGAAQRRLGASQGLTGGPESSQGGEESLVDGQSPEDIVLSDMQEQMDSQIEPPDITQTAASTMMRYGIVESYLMRARGEMPDG